MEATAFWEQRRDDVERILQRYDRDVLNGCNVRIRSRAGRPLADFPRY